MPGRKVVKSLAWFDDEFIEFNKHPPHTFPATPERQIIRPYDFDDFHDRSLAETAMIDEQSQMTDSKPQSMSMRSVVMIVILVRRFIARGLGRQQKSSGRGGNPTLKHILFPKRSLAAPISKNSDVA